MRKTDNFILLAAIVRTFSKFFKSITAQVIEGDNFMNFMIFFYVSMFVRINQVIAFHHWTRFAQ